MRYLLCCAFLSNSHQNERNANAIQRRVYFNQKNVQFVEYNKRTIKILCFMRLKYNSQHKKFVVTVFKKNKIF